MRYIPIVFLLLLQFSSFVYANNEDSQGNANNTTTEVGNVEQPEAKPKLQKAEVNDQQLKELKARAAEEAAAIMNELHQKRDEQAKVLKKLEESNKAVMEERDRVEAERKQRELQELLELAEKSRKEAAKAKKAEKMKENS